MADFPTATAHFPNTPGDCLSPVFPRYYECDDAVDRLVYFNPAALAHPKRCFNELLASRLGQLIDAPVPVVSLVYVPNEVVADLAGNPWDGSFDVAGWHCGFERPSEIVALRNDRPQSAIVNLSAIADGIALGGWMDGWNGVAYMTGDSRVQFGWNSVAFTGIVNNLPGPNPLHNYSLPLQKR